MTRGQSQPGVKSHRKGRRKRIVRRKLPVAPWIVISTVLVLVASVLVAGYILLLGVGCSGDPVRATVAVAPSLQSTLSSLANEWESDEPAIGGQCIGVEVIKKSSSEVASRLGGSWDTSKDGKRPDVWIPESTAWLQMARLTDAGQEIIPDNTPFIATSPTVIAMPQPMAEALGWQPGGKPVDDVEPSWKNLVKLAGESDWSDFGKDWGKISLGMINPKDSTPGLHALLSLVDDNQNGSVDSAELDNVANLRSAATDSVASVDDLMDKMAQADADGDPFGYVSAFPALERDVWRYNTRMNTEVKLVPVYPADGSLDADHPMAVLHANWTTKTSQEIGDQFADFLQRKQSQDELKDDGYRDGTHRAGSETLTTAEGMVPQIEVPQREPMRPKTVYRTLTTWQALNQSTNILIVVDSSESMNTTETFDGKEQTRMDIIAGELKNTLDLFGEKTSLGLWDYSSDLNFTGVDYRELMPIQDFDSGVRDQAKNQLDLIQPMGDSGLYDTAVEAYRNLLENYNSDPGAVNLVMLISDGGNEDPQGGISAEEMRATMAELQAANRDKTASLMTVGFGPDANAEQLTDVANSARGTYNPAQYADQINTALLNALFYPS